VGKKLSSFSQLLNKSFGFPSITQILLRDLSEAVNYVPRTQALKNLKIKQVQKIFSKLNDCEYIGKWK